MDAGRTVRRWHSVRGRLDPAKRRSSCSAEDLDQFPLGPVRGGIEPAAHLRLGVRGETVVRMEARLGYTHKGTLTLMRGKSPRAAARFAARLAGEATVAHSIAFARATEAVSGGELPPRALALRDVMAEIERIACHLDVLSAMAEITGVEALVTRTAWHAEAIRRAAYTAFGHRLMMDCVIPGGVAADIVPGGGEAIGRALSALAAEPLHFPVTGAAKAHARDRLAEIQGDLGAAQDLLGELPGGCGVGAAAGGERRRDRLRQRPRWRHLALATPGSRPDRQRVHVRSGMGALAGA